MMHNNGFHHALTFNREICVGCSHCMKVCPTQAIRVYGGKAELMPDRCIDCGECYRVCPVDAIRVEQDDFDLIFNYKNRVALVPGILMGQLADDISTPQLYSVLIELGFTHVVEVETGAEILKHAMKQYIADHPEIRPLISAFCPAIVRLIQVKFPSLVNHIITMKPPLDVAGMYARKMLEMQGADLQETGLFYITPCAAKIAAIKSPVGEEKSVINGVINMDFIYNKVLTTARQSKSQSCPLTETPSLSSEVILWSLTTGEAGIMGGRSLAIDGINNVIEFLEELENEEVSQIDFLELRSCDESCAGGILTNTNRFLTAESLRNRATQNSTTGPLSPPEAPHDILSFSDFLNQHLVVDKVRPRSMLKLDENIQGALEKMKRVNELMEILPYVDCGICGAPTCTALAEDIVKEESQLARCIFIQRILEQKGTFTQEDSVAIMKNIWGEEKLNKHIK
jgi:iron only hydrogenase large subunit-like protein